VREDSDHRRHRPARARFDTEHHDLWRAPAPPELEALSLPKAATSASAAAGKRKDVTARPSAGMSAKLASAVSSGSSASSASSGNSSSGESSSSPPPAESEPAVAAPAEPVPVGSVAELSQFIETQKKQKQQQSQNGASGSSKKAANSAKKGAGSRSASKKDKPASAAAAVDESFEADESSSTQRPASTKQNGWRAHKPGASPQSLTSAAGKKRHQRSKRESDADASAADVALKRRAGRGTSRKTLLISAAGALLAALLIYALFFTTLSPDPTVPNNVRSSTAARS